MSNVCLAIISRFRVRLGISRLDEAGRVKIKDKSHKIKVKKGSAGALFFFVKKA